MANSRWFSILSGAVCLPLLSSPASAALLFNQASSFIKYEHDVIEGGVVSRTKNQPSPLIGTPTTVTYVLPDLTLNGVADGLPSTFRSQARAGMGHNETATVGTGVVKANTLITQSDPGDFSDEFSTLTINYHLVWNVTAPGFGPPLIGSFSVPLLAVVGAGGEAKAEVLDMTWERFDGVTTSNLRTPAAPTSLTFGAGSTLTILNVPGAVFTPFNLTTGDQFIVSGTLKLSVKNALSPTSVILKPDYQSFVAEDQVLVNYRFDDGPLGNAPAVAVNSGSLGAGFNGNYGPGTQLVPGLVQAAIAVNVPGTGVQGFIPGTPSMTAEVWAASATPTWNTDGWLADASGNNGFLINPIAGTTSWQGILFDLGGFPQIIGEFDAGPFDITQLHQYAISYDDATSMAIMYFDGVPVASTLLGSFGRGASGPVSLILGANGAGRLDEFSYFDYAIDPNLMALHFQVGTNPCPIDLVIGVEIFEVPEPATTILMLAAFTVVGGGRRRREMLQEATLV